jgi:hypothetical protein
VIYPEFLTMSPEALDSANPLKDDRKPLWLADPAILNLQDTWQDSFLPIITSSSDSRFEQWSDAQGKVWEWIADAKRIAVAGYDCRLEDDSELCSAES